MIKQTFLALLLTASSFVSGAVPVDSATALQRLMEGNGRYVNEESTAEMDLEAKRNELVSSQAPFAIIVGCSDSRVPPELIFDQSLGDIFVVRVAGNVVGPVEMDSIEFAVDKLACPLIMVLSHQNCGAVSAVLEGKSADADLANIAPLIQRAVDQSKNLPGDPLKNAILSNVQLNRKRLEKNTTIKSLVEKKKLQIVGGYYELQSGQVALLTNREH